jgi:hypothetical protein
MQTLKAGTRVEIHGTPAFPGFPGVAPVGGTILRWTRVNGPEKNRARRGGEAKWHIVRFDDSGGALCVHESNFRVVDNR